MIRRVLIVALALSACGQGTTEPPGSERHEGTSTARITGAEAREWDGTSVFYQGGDGFSMVAKGPAAGENDHIVVHGASRPAVGTYRIGLADAPYHAFNSRTQESGPGMTAYAAEAGELRITHSSAQRLEGSFTYTGFLYCRVTETTREGPCSPPSAPIEGAPRIQVTGSFSAIPHDQVPVTEVVVPATIDFYGDPVVIQVPESVGRGEAIRILVRSYGDGCTSMARTDVHVQGRTVTVEPMNRELRGAVCTQQLVVVDHAAEVRFDAAGPVTVVVKGTRKPGNNLVTFERTVQVR